MKEKEFDKLMRQKMEAYEMDFPDGQKNLGWSAIEGQLPSSWWHTFWQSVKPWLWVPVLTSIAVLNYFWWQQTQQIHTDTNRLIYTIERMHGQIDSLELQIKNLPEKSRIDTVYILNGAARYSNYRSWAFPNQTSKGQSSDIQLQNAGIGNMDYFDYNNRGNKNFYPASGQRQKPSKVNAIANNNTSLEDSSDEENQNLKGTGLGFNESSNAEESAIDLTEKEVGTEQYTKRESTLIENMYTGLDSLERIPIKGMDTIIFRHEKIKELPAREVDEKESFHLGKALGKLLPIQSKWGLSTGLSTPRPEQGEAYVAPSVGLQASFLYSEHWRVSLSALYQRRGYELYEVYERNYGESLIQRFPGLEDFRQGDYIRDIESIQNRVVIPLQLRYFFKQGRDRMRPFVGIGWLGSFNINQELEYRFEDEDDYDDEPFNPQGFPNSGEGIGSRFNGSAAEVTLGFEYALSRKWALQWSAYYQNEFAPSNVELNKLNTIGMRLSILYGR